MTVSEAINNKQLRVSNNNNKNTTDTKLDEEDLTRHNFESAILSSSMNDSELFS